MRVIVTAIVVALAFGTAPEPTAAQGLKDQVACAKQAERYFPQNTTFPDITVQHWEGYYNSKMNRCFVYEEQLDIKGPENHLWRWRTYTIFDAFSRQTWAEMTVGCYRSEPTDCYYESTPDLKVECHTPGLNTFYCKPADFAAFKKEALED